MKISLIAAIGKNNELGKGNDLVFKLPADMKHFKNITTPYTVIMGRKTYESIGEPLPNRRNIVITRNKNYPPKAIEIANSLEEAIKLADSPIENEEIFIIGGGEIYKEAINKADKLYITEVNAEDKDANIFFPQIDPSIFKETKREKYQKDEKNIYDYDFVEYERIILA